MEAKYDDSMPNSGLLVRKKSNNQEGIFTSSAEPWLLIAPEFRINELASPKSDLGQLLMQPDYGVILDQDIFDWREALVKGSAWVLRQVF
jgi:hypothetical protein